jgi:hypothetical protein
MNHKGYDQALNLAKEKLAQSDPDEIFSKTGVHFTGLTWELPWFGTMTDINLGSTEELILRYHYALGNGPKTLSSTYISYKQVPGAGIYNDNFIKRTIAPMVKGFADDLEHFLKCGQALGGKQVSVGHMAFTLYPFEYVPLTYVLWQGDDEVPPSGTILFDETAAQWLCAEDLVVLAGIPVYAMLKMTSTKKE